MATLKIANLILRHLHPSGYPPAVIDKLLPILFLFQSHHQEHFLNPHGNKAKDMPSEAKELASFLPLIIEDVTDLDKEAWGFETDVSCNQKNCQRKIHSRLLIEEDHEILW